MKSMLYKAVMPLALAALLAGCGGGDGNNGGFYPVTPVTAVPPVATIPSDNNPGGPMDPQPMASAYGKFIAYVTALVAQALDTAEPADVTAYDPPPTSETNEPVATQ